MAEFAAATAVWDWDSVMELTEAAQLSGTTDPRRWALHLSSALSSAGVSLPSPELARLLVSHTFCSSSVPAAWKFLDAALSANLVPSFLVIALLSVKVIPCRRLYPAAYRLYMEILIRHGFKFSSHIHGPNYHQIMIYVDDVLHLSKLFGLQAGESGILLVGFIFAIVWQLLDASLDDNRLLELTPEKCSIWTIRSATTDVGGLNIDNERKKMHKLNTVMAVEMMGEFLRNKMVSRILKLACRTMPSHWDRFIQRLQVLAENSLAFRHLNFRNQEAIIQWASHENSILPQNPNKSSQERFHATITSRTSFSFVGQYDGASHSAVWLPLDLFMEDVAGWLQVVSASSVDILAGLVKSLRAINNASWHDTFLALWSAALRLVQRGRNTFEGLLSHLDHCLLILLSVTPLAIINILEEEEEGRLTDKSLLRTEDQARGFCHHGFISSLQLMGEYKSLLTPVPNLNLKASLAAAKGTIPLSGALDSEHHECMSINNMMDRCSGNLWHLIVEACIARNLVEKSAYSWPGYLNGCTPQIPQTISAQLPGWSALMSGSPLTPSLINVLISTPASSLEEIKKVYEIAINGSDDEKIPAAEILCGETLMHGWNIHEHTVLFILRLLSPPVPSDYSGEKSHLIGHAPVLSVIVNAISVFDRILMFYLYGWVPQLAVALMHICEAFGSCLPNFSWTLTSGEIISAHSVFSYSVLVLLRIWMFDEPPIDRMMPQSFFMGPQYSPEYLLSILNSELASSETTKCQHKRWKGIRNLMPMSGKPMTLVSFARLNLWYQQQVAFNNTDLSHLPSGDPVCQVADKLLNMMLRKRTSCGEPSASTNSRSGTSFGETEDACHELMLPAWDILEALPSVLDIVLRACSEGRLSPPELTIGLKILVDFLPASLGTILACFAAEVRRGVWKPVIMNGVDWPSPAVNLSTVEQDIKEMMAFINVDISIAETGDSSRVSVPLPLAALICLSITYKMEGATERVMGSLGHTMHTLAGGCRWPCTSILNALWTQKINQEKFINFYGGCTLFFNNHEAVVQLLKSCFSSVLALGDSPCSNNVGLGALLGDGFVSPRGEHSHIPPGIFYLRIHRHLHDVTFLAREILSMLVLSIRKLSPDKNAKEHLIKPRATNLPTGIGLRQVSLASLMKQVKFAASFGASLLWLSGEANLVQTLFKETLPSWLMCGRDLESEGAQASGVVAKLQGYGLAYFALYSGTFGWGVDSALPASKRRPSVLRFHLEFLANWMDRKIVPYCGWATWRAYVSGFLGLMVEYVPAWVCEVDANVLKRLSKGLRQWNEEGLAMALLLNGDVSAMSAAAELITDIF